ncbi:uncharacterized protein EURHEDRAFT_181671 [Aspergillus ruber CBS 135680]|uniref:Uncharacterized protein n=1 Tax=Aspergillus ruber (strain CBS 135680) TaxID=1388766 RepID=A0A017S859_ASPRC|nr:uncharacterized protein EURHEDRAFT_181671 [Aspergillus ruber CBS 135680]EYE92819.1 hypothetical protein EURHEDRAFT_181671 [Aspergillus ruber CBS 135680]
MKCYKSGFIHHALLHPITLQFLPWSAFSSVGFPFWLLVEALGISRSRLRRIGKAMMFAYKKSVSTSAGDLLLLECNALHTVKKWPGFYERLEAISTKPSET